MSSIKPPVEKDYKITLNNHTPAPRPIKETNIIPTSNVAQLSNRVAKLSFEDSKQILTNKGSGNSNGNKLNEQGHSKVEIRNLKARMGSISKKPKRKDSKTSLEP